MSPEMDNECPAREVYAELWELNNEDHARARAIFEPLADTLTSRLYTDMSTPGFAARTVARPQVMYSGIIGELPYGRQYVCTPALMVDRDRPALPQDKKEVKRAADRYEAAIADMRKENPRRFIVPLSWSDAEAVAQMGMRCREDGLALDAAKWAVQQRTTDEHIRSGKYFIDAYQYERLVSVAGALGAVADVIFKGRIGSGRFETFFGATTDAAFYESDQETINAVGGGKLAAPIGAYGPDIARHLLQSAVHGINTGHILYNQADQLARGNEDIITMRMARGWGREQGTDGAALVATVQEGIRSDMELKSMFLAEKVPGYNNPYDLLEAIAEKKLIEKLTRSIPFGVIGPAALAGVYFPGLLQNTGGDLQINTVILNTLRGHRAIQQRAMLEQHRIANTQYKSRYDQYITGFGLPCVAAMPGGALEKISRAQTQATLLLEGS